MDQCWRQWINKLLTLVPKSHWSQHRSVTRIQNFATSATTRSVESFQQCRKMPQVQSLGGRLSSSRSLTPKQVGNTCATCRGIADNAIAHPSAQKRIRRVWWIWLRGKSVKSLRFGPKYDVTQPLVLTRIRQDVSAGKCVAAMISQRVNTARALPKLFPPMLPSQIRFILLACFASWLWDVP